MSEITFLPILIAALSVIVAATHSWLTEAKILGPLYAEKHSGVLASPVMRDVNRLVWHLPSLAWVLFGLALFFGTGPQVALHWAAFIMFALSGVGQLAALKRFHIGWLLFFVLAALIFTDLNIKAN